MHSTKFLSSAATICHQLDAEQLEEMCEELVSLRERNGRLFILGVGGSSANASHAVNDFRKLCGIEAYAPTENVSELTARTNDEGWESVFAGWLEISRLDKKDALLIFSVGGGDSERNVSANLIAAINMAKQAGAKVYGIVGRRTGYTAQNGDNVVIVPSPEQNWITPLSEAFQAVVWHCLVSNPKLQIKKTKW